MSRAPAKIILFGEHAVVYGQPAIAAPFEALYASAEARPGTPGKGLLIRALDTGKQYRVRANETQYRDALAIAAQLVLRHLNVPPPDLVLELRSTIPIASGLGSGAAVTTALMRELSRAVGKPLTNEPLNKLVYEIETLYHGTPSGIDNTVIVFGHPVYFIRGAAPELFGVGTPLTLIIADSGIPHSTRETIGDVRKLFEADPANTVPILEGIGRLSHLARRAIEEGDEATIGGLMTENHRLLASLSVSSDVLDRLVRAARDAGALGAKLSGGGRGGNVIALVRPATAEGVAAALSEAGAATTWQTVIQS